MSFWSQNEIAFLQNNLEMSTKNLYQAFLSNFGQVRTYDSIQKQIRKLRIQFQDTPDDLLNTDIGTAIINEIDSQPFLSVFPPSAFFPIFTPTNEVTPTIPFNEVKQETKQWIADLLPLVGKSYIRPTPVSSSKPSMVVLLSDTHFGKLTDTFNMDIAKERIETLPKTIQENGNILDIDEIVVVLCGDMIEGEDIYPTQNGAIEAPAITQIKVATKAFWQMIKNFRATFPKAIVRVETAPGNHGRTSKTADKRTNWDNVIYQTLCLLSEETKDPMIQVVPNLEWLHEFKVKGKKCLAYHYGVKHTGTPAMQVKIANWIVTKNIDFMVKGHHHKWEVGTHLGRPIISNGSLPGPDEYSEELALDEPSRQAWFYVQEGKPLFGFNFVQWD